MYEIVMFILTEELCRVIREMKRAVSTPEAASTSNIVKQMYRTKVAGRASEYVNSVLEEVSVSGAAIYVSSDSD